MSSGGISTRNSHKAIGIKYDVTGKSNEIKQNTGATYDSNPQSDDQQHYR
jgi:hypothetical protein